MNPKWQIVFCDEMEDGCPVTQFINTCQPKHQVKILRLLSLLEEQGPTLPRPYADILTDGIHELRFSLSRDNVRVLYFFCYQRFIVLYSAFFKNTRKVPERHINKVVKYRDHFLSRISKAKLEKVSHVIF
ncbi:MAG: type II toxin-antitoxin system RelE/ParE family toxin [Desulfobacula sp.]|nr:type II toxin-antitoxin system RelE/ParE family toxin [Desulfobacula sp.]